jgi:hypothetical protein
LGTRIPLRQRLRDDAATRWAVDADLAEKLFLVPLVGSVLVALTRLYLPLFSFLLREDSLLEWLQFAGYLTASITGLLIAIRLRSSGHPASVLLFLALALGCFFVAGEEIAWGQRILDTPTPEALREINRQQETTLHNIGGLQAAFNVLQMLLGLYGSLGAWLAGTWAHGWLRRHANLLLPPLFLSSAFLIIFLYRLVRLTLFPPPTAYTIWQYAEWPECCLALALAAFTLLTLRNRLPTPMRPPQR